MQSPQGVSRQREQTRVFQLTDLEDLSQVQTVVNAAYRQVFERDLESHVNAEFGDLERKLQAGAITVKAFVLALGGSELYIRQFYTPYPNTKVIELGTKHFLGRAPIHQAEVRKYNQILATDGLRHFIEALVSSVEYAQVFGDDVVPYRRFPSGPASSFTNTERLHNQFVKQTDEISNPGFEPVTGQLSINTQIPTDFDQIPDNGGNEGSLPPGRNP